MAAVNIADLRRLAKKRLPRFVFDYVDGAAHDEKTLRWNESGFDAWRLRHRALVDVSQRQLGVAVLGREQALPLILAPIGFCGLVAPQGEQQSARAAQAAGIPFCLSTAAIASMEDLRAAAPAPFWFQLYVTKDRGVTRDLLARAAANGCPVLAVTVDIAANARRERDVRSGFIRADRMTLATRLDIARHWRWAFSMLRAPKPVFGNLRNYSGAGNDIQSQAQFVGRNMDFTLNWRDIEWLRAQWRGKLVVKGIVDPGDARRAAECGADGLVVSNHGGRQLDGDIATIAALPAVAEAVGDRLDVLFDSGIRRGQDVVKALALGAKACLIGRAYIYGLGALGQAGVTRAIEILKDEIDTTIAHLGVSDVRELAKRRGEYLVKA